MGQNSELSIGIDISKLNNAVAIAEAARGGEIETTDAATRKLAATHAKLTFCYEAGPTGYGLCRLIKSLGHACIVVAPDMANPHARRRDGLADSTGTVDGRQDGHSHRAEAATEQRPGSPRVGCVAGFAERSAASTPEP